MKKILNFVGKYLFTPIGVVIGVPFVVFGLIVGILFNSVKQGYKMTVGIDDYIK